MIGKTIAPMEQMRNLELAQMKFAPRVADGNVPMNPNVWISCSFVMEEEEDAKTGVTSPKKHVLKMFVTARDDGNVLEKTNASIHGPFVMGRQIVKQEVMKIHICARMNFVRAHFSVVSKVDGNAPMKPNVWINIKFVMDTKIAMMDLVMKSIV